MKRLTIIGAVIALMLLSVTVAYATGPYPALDATATARVAHANAVSTAAYRKADDATTTALSPTAPKATATATATATVQYGRGVNLAGADFGETHLPGVYGTDYTYPTASELDYYRGKGLNLIRLPFRWERMQPTLSGPLDPAQLGYMDTFIAAAKARNMSVILDAHNYGRYNGAVIGSDAVTNTNFADFWKRLAAHYRGETAITGFGLSNEPHDMSGHWPAAAQAATDAIRATDTTHAVIVAGDCWSGAAQWQDCNANLAVNDSTGNIIYEAHEYFDRDHSGTYPVGATGTSYDAAGAPTEGSGATLVQPFLSWLTAHNARGFMGEYGVANDDPRWLPVLDGFLTALDGAKVSGTYWAAGPWWGEYVTTIEPKGGGDRPPMAILTRHLGSGATPPATATVTVAPTTPVPSPTVVAPATAKPTATVATTPATATVAAANNGTAVCTDPGDGAVDQNGVSVDVWAAGARRACGYLGYESGDNPMPSGTLLPAPRPFRFDYTYDHNESVNGFKVFYHTGISGNGCGDVRQILHMGMGTGRYDAPTHTMQIAAVQCTNNDRTTARIIDVAGQGDAGCLLTKQMHVNNVYCSGNQNERLEAAQGDCGTGNANNNTLDANKEYTRGDICWPVWYATVHFDKPSGGTGNFEGSIIVRDPQTWLDAPTQVFDANGNVTHTNAYIAAGGEGSARGMNVAYADSFAGGTSATWCAGYDAARRTNTVVACGTPGAWTQRVDSAVTMDVSGLTGDFISGAGGTDQHPRTVPFGAGLTFPN